MARGRRFAWAAGLFLMLPGIATAQINPTLNEAERGIKDRDRGAAEHLRIAEFLVSAHVAGRTADMTIEMLIDSDNSYSYEATFAVALPSDAVVTGYALSVDDRLIPGQLLEQPKARNVYEDEVRAGIDPGLAEVSAGNRFTTRIYPIDREHPRRFRLSFVAPFDPEKGILLPLSRDAIGKLRFDVTVDGYDSPPTVQFAGKTVALTRDGRSWRGKAGDDKQTLRDGLAITGGTLRGPMTVTQHASGEQFFVISDHAIGAPAKSRPGRLRVYWDRSLSHGRDGVDLEIDALARLIDATAPTAIDLVTFASDKPRTATVTDVAGLRRALKALGYRGGTSLAGLDGLALAPASQCVLVFDGQVTIDRGTEFSPDCPLSVLTASTVADGARLGRIAQGTAKVVRVTEGKAAEGARALAPGQIGVLSVRDESGRRLAFRMLPAGPGGWLLVGQMPDGGNVRVRLSDASERTYAAEGAAVRADAPGGLWAAQRVQVLGDDPSRHQAMVDLARRYQIAGPAMSFLVMERPDQYLRAGIAPPADFSEAWLRDYREQKDDSDQEIAGDRRARFDFVLNQWKERKLWWNRRFVAGPRPKRAPPGFAVAEPAPPPSVVMPAPVPSSTYGRSSSQIVDAIGAGGGGDEDSIIVTSSRPDLATVREARPADGKEIQLDLADLIAKRPYIVALDAASPATRSKVLDEQERAYGSLPSFYFDTAEWFRLKGDMATAELLLLSALELPLGDDETRQIIAFRLERDKSYQRAVELGEQLAAANAEFRPQPARDLALALAARGRSRGAAGRADLERAFALLVDAALNPASRDFDGFELIALMDANALIPDIEAAGGKWSLDDHLVALLDTDARIVIEWTADDADIDLWVDEPNRERVFYGDKLSSAGGQISNDMTDGYGPEEYAIRRAPAGNYAVRINGYDADRLNPNGPGHVLIRLIRNFGRRTESEAMVDVDLSFQQGRNRDEDSNAKPVATLKVAK